MTFSSTAGVISLEVTAHISVPSSPDNRNHHTGVRSSSRSRQKPEKFLYGISQTSDVDANPRSFTPRCSGKNLCGQTFQYSSKSWLIHQFRFNASAHNGCSVARFQFSPQMPTVRVVCLWPQGSAETLRISLIPTKHLWSDQTLDHQPVMLWFCFPFSHTHTYTVCHGCFKHCTIKKSRPPRVIINHRFLNDSLLCYCFPNNRRTEQFTTVLLRPAVH